MYNCELCQYWDEAAWRQIAVFCAVAKVRAGIIAGAGSSRSLVGITTWAIVEKAVGGHAVVLGVAAVALNS